MVYSRLPGNRVMAAGTAILSPYRPVEGTGWRELCPERRSGTCVSGTPIEQKVREINPHLDDLPFKFLKKRREPLSEYPKLMFGNVPNDGGNLLLTTEEKEIMIAEDPRAERFIRRFIRAKDYLYRQDSWCLWIKDVSPSDYSNIKPIVKRIDAVRQFRLKSIRKSTVKTGGQTVSFRRD